MTTPELEEQWYTALRTENCETVMRLLKNDSSLLKVGWKDDPSRFSSGTRWDPSSNLEKPDEDGQWTGRTALHVGARRGCVDLIKRVLLLCGLDKVKEYCIVYEESEADNISAPSQSQFDPQGGGDGGQVGDDTGPARAILRAKFQKAVSTIIASNRVVHALRKEQVQLTDTVEVSIAPSSEDSTLEKEVSSDLGTTSAVTFSPKDLTEILSVKHGSYQIDALGMAAIHCNMDIIVLLIYAYTECDSPLTPLALGRSTPLSRTGRLGRALVDTLSPRIADEREQAYNESRAHLRDVTRQFVERLDAATRRKFSDEYSNDLDFNFLPIEEYLFHFCSTSEKFNTVGWALWDDIKSAGRSLWRFSLKLHDGQGRTPFHVAVDRAKAEQFVKLFRDEAREQKMLICALTARDAAGRTPAHRAAVMVSDRGAGALRIILYYYEKHNAISTTCHVTWRHPCGEYELDVRNNFNYFDESEYELRVRDDFDDFGKNTAPRRSGNCSFWYGIPRILSYFSKLNGLRATPQGYSPLHGAIIHRNYDIAKLLIRKFSDVEVHNTWYFQESRPAVEDEPRHFANIDAQVIEWGLIEFACLVRAEVGFVRFLLEEYLPQGKQMQMNGHKEDPLWPGVPKKVVKRNLWEAIHLIASFGDYKMIELFIDDMRTDPFAADFEGNTILHHCMKVRQFELGVHLLDIFLDFRGFNPGNFQITSQLKSHGRDYEEDEERQKSIILFLQSGCDILQTNHRNQVPYPQGDLKKSEFLSWWRQIQEKEFLAVQTKANFDSNAITVAAALVATASYVGPLQPPMGYVGDPNQIHDSNVWVILFIVCDTMSFYLAVASILLSLFLCVPRHQQSIMEDLLRTRRMLTYAIALLFPSVCFVFVAFGCSSLAVISASITSSTAGALTIATTCLGGLLCVVTVSVTFVKLLAFIFPSKLIKFVYSHF